MQRKRYWTLARMRRLVTAMAVAEEEIGSLEAALAAEVEKQAAPAGPGEGLERAVRSRSFRLTKPGALERYRYSLMPNGDPDWEREPRKGALALLRAAKAKHGSPGAKRTESSGCDSRGQRRGGR